MKSPGKIIFLCLVGWTAARLCADEWLDPLDQALTFSSADQTWRARLSGTLDLTAYDSPDPVSNLIFSNQEFLVEPRLTVFLDAQMGSRAYLFAQARADRGFDPTDKGLELRLDEYALRVTAWEAGRLSIQVGKFATVVGNWTSRHSVWDNPLVSAPLPYDNLTSLWYVAPAPSVDSLLGWGHVKPASTGEQVGLDKDRRLPVIWGPAYTTGVAIAGAWDRVEYALEMKNAAIASRPEYWNSSDTGWSHPSFSGRLGVRPSESWNLGFSASQGNYLSPEAIDALPPGKDSRAYRETLLGQDASFAWHHFQAWAEVYEARFEVPAIGPVRTIAYYLETKYKFTPQLSGALRWNQQYFSNVTDAAGENFDWSRQVSRLDLGGAYRFSEDTQVKVEFSIRHERPSPEGTTHSISLQWVLRF